ncbi:hypothetical protein GGQ85_000236 [Nitrobacter vulgaris]|uniref:terminase large subunit domain-containing protein n=1 Tax=Nitrobacter vulgaris TaxID=29421 RepID=UPI00286041C0|nr:terminase family protein [Nitrobacter vulgaris]MDR6302560.1 hypothetical protein [Nitrobacter vulgaris]
MTVRVRHKPRHLGTTILDAINDPALFAPAFKNPESWAAWHVFLSALFGLPLNDEQRELFRECTRRDAPNLEGHTEAWLVCGRRGGKSFIMALTAVYLATFKDYTQHLSPGERGTIMLIAQDRRQARVLVRYIKGLLHSVPMLKALIDSERTDQIDLCNRVTIEVHTASFRSTRGYSIVAAVLDEIAFWPIENAAEPDTEIIAALRPGMASIPGSIMLCASSPYARKGALWESYKTHFGKNGDPCLVWQAPTRTMNPSITQSVINYEMERDPAKAAAEYGAEFRTDVESFVSLEVIKACIAQGVFERPHQSRFRYFAFVDPSGGSADSFTLAIAHRDADSLFLDAIREVRPPFSPESVVIEYAGLMRSYRITKVTGDRYAGEWPREQFRKYGVRYEVADKSKSDIYRDMLPLLNSRRCELLDHSKLVSQFVSLERRTARGGRDSIDHPSHSHDDIANAVAGVLTETATPRRFTIFSAHGAAQLEIHRKLNRGMSNAERNSCIPGKGLDAELSLFNAQRGFLPYPVRRQ